MASSSKHVDRKMKVPNDSTIHSRHGPTIAQPRRSTRSVKQPLLFEGLIRTLVKGKKTMRPEKTSVKEGLEKKEMQQLLEKEKI
jgi:hypothetical protein